MSLSRLCQNRQMRERTAPQRIRSFQPAANQVSGILQRGCAPCGNHTVAGRECEKHKNVRKGTLQRVAINPSSVHDVPPVVHEALHSPSQQLDGEMRAIMEPRLGHDFSRVRVHTDVQAADSARAVNALAYTVGRDVVFGAGQYAPGTAQGQRLLAHELAHVVQQGGSTSEVYSTEGLRIGHAMDRSEREADAVSRLVDTAQPLPSIHSVSGGVIARQANEEDVSATAEPVTQGDEDATEVEAVASDEFETLLPADKGQVGAQPTKSPSPSPPQKKARKPQTYTADVNLSLPDIGKPDRSLNTAQISALAGDAAGTTAGLTQFRIAYKTAVRQAFKGTKHWVTSIKVWLSGVTFKVFLTSQYPPGSCADKDLLRHEMHHVSDNRKNTANGEKAAEMRLRRACGLMSHDRSTTPQSAVRICARKSQH